MVSKRSCSHPVEELDCIGGMDGIDIYDCNSCGYSVLIPKDKNHLIYHVGSERDKQYECANCGERARSPGDFKRFDCTSDESKI